MAALHRLDANDTAWLWLDVETTGLDPDRDRLLQVAGMLTDPHLRQVGPAFDHVVGYPAGDTDRMRGDAEPVVRDMHDRTGLWGRLPGGVPLGDIETELCRYLDVYAPGPRRARLAGSSVSGVDMPFVRRWLPAVAGRLHYRVVDVSTVAHLAQVWGWTPGTYPKRRTHDATEDIRESIAELAWIRDHIETQEGGA